MTHKQKKFVEAYLGEANGNATEAARIAGYEGNENTLAVIGAENIRKPKIAEMIGERIQENKVDTDYVIAGVRAIAEKDKARDGDKLKALELLGKFLALWTENKRHDVRVEFGWADDSPDS